jgi:hypothetical protein
MSEKKDPKEETEDPEYWALISLAVVKRLVGAGKAAILNWCAAGTFPPYVRNSPRGKLFFHKGPVMSWLRERPTERPRVKTPKGKSGDEPKSEEGE